MHTDALAVLDFWFGPPDDPGHAQPRPQWFQKDDAFDAQIRQRFSSMPKTCSSRHITLPEPLLGRRRQTPRPRGTPRHLVGGHVFARAQSMMSFSAGRWPGRSARSTTTAFTVSPR
jgi:hypothetical protein